MSENKFRHLKAFRKLSEKMGENHNLYVPLEIDGEYQEVPIWLLLEQQRLEIESKFVDLQENVMNPSDNATLGRVIKKLLRERGIEEFYTPRLSNKYLYLKYYQS